MRYLIFSDTHGHTEFLDEWLSRHHKAVDGLVSAGDFYRDGQELAQAFNLPYFGAQGNNDHEPESPWHTIWTVQGLSIGVIHSHQWSATDRIVKIEEWAQQRGCRMVIFGHSHVRLYRPGPITLLNPGALFRPRNQEPKTCALLTVEPTQADPFAVEWILADEDH